ncbi:MAG: hypothetical protein LBC85_07725 [Fibromonadaceae bacterium]|nr:hypothetical protein [Fibromonadaceae bacterium]
MNTPAITTRVADLIRNPDSAMPSDWERSAKNKQISSPESVTQEIPRSSSTNLSFSPLAIKILEEVETRGPSDWEKTRDDRVQRVQQLVQERQYSLSPEMIDNIAQRIVSMFP